MELKQFITFDVFTPEKKNSLPKGSNIVDCVWVRKWKNKPTLIKSRLCSRGCFDKQKYAIERHSSTATRLSQRIVLSMAQIEDSPADDPVDIESWDISSAFLQGFKYSDLMQMARKLGYEVKEPRHVWVDPPENCWRHWRKMKEAQIARGGRCRRASRVRRS